MYSAPLNAALLFVTLNIHTSICANRRQICVGTSLCITRWSRAARTSVHLALCTNDDRSICPAIALMPPRKHAIKFLGHCCCCDKSITQMHQTQQSKYIPTYVCGMHGLLWCKQIILQTWCNIYIYIVQVHVIYLLTETVHRSERADDSGIIKCASRVCLCQVPTNLFQDYTVSRSQTYALACFASECTRKWFFLNYYNCARVHLTRVRWHVKTHDNMKYDHNTSTSSKQDRFRSIRKRFHKKPEHIVYIKFWMFECFPNI